MCQAPGAEQIQSPALGWWNFQIEGAFVTTEQRTKASRQSGGASPTAGENRNRTEKRNLNGGQAVRPPEALLKS